MSTLSCIPKTSGVWDKGSSYSTQEASVNRSGSILVNPQDYGRRIYLDKLYILIVWTFWRSVVSATLWEFVLRILYNLRSVKVCQDTHKAPSETTKWKHSSQPWWRLCKLFKIFEVLIYKVNLGIYLLRYVKKGFYLSWHHSVRACPI